jgi:hypothetical protein
MEELRRGLLVFQKSMADVLQVVHHNDKHQFEESLKAVMQYANAVTRGWQTSKLIQESIVRLFTISDGLAVREGNRQAFLEELHPFIGELSQ